MCALGLRVRKLSKEQGALAEQTVSIGQHGQKMSGRSRVLLLPEVALQSFIVTWNTTGRHAEARSFGSCSKNCVDATRGTTARPSPGCTPLRIASRRVLSVKSKHHSCEGLSLTVSS